LLQRFLGRPKPGEAEAESAREAAAAHDAQKEKASDEAARAQDYRDTTAPPRDDSPARQDGKRADEVSP
jgi:hypothetical protein